MTFVIGFVLSALPLPETIIDWLEHSGNNFEFLTGSYKIEIENI